MSADESAESKRILSRWGLVFGLLPVVFGGLCGATSIAVFMAIVYSDLSARPEYTQPLSTNLLTLDQGDERDDSRLDDSVMQRVILSNLLLEDRRWTWEEASKRADELHDPYVVADINRVLALVAPTPADADARLQAALAAAARSESIESCFDLLELASAARHLKRDAMEARICSKLEEVMLEPDIKYESLLLELVLKQHGVCIH